MGVGNHETAQKFCMVPIVVEFTETESRMTVTRAAGLSMVVVSWVWSFSFAK